MDASNFKVHATNFIGSSISDRLAIRVVYTNPNGRRITKNRNKVFMPYLNMTPFTTQPVEQTNVDKQLIADSVSISQFESNKIPISDDSGMNTPPPLDNNSPELTDLYSITSNPGPSDSKVDNNFLSEPTADNLYNPSFTPSVQGLHLLEIYGKSDILTSYQSIRQLTCDDFIVALQYTFDHFNAPSKLFLEPANELIFLQNLHFYEYIWGKGIDAMFYDDSQFIVCNHLSRSVVYHVLSHTVTYPKK